MDSLLIHNPMVNMKYILIAFCLFVVTPTQCFAQEMPKRRAGLWEITVGGEQPSQVVKQCTDAATDNQLINSGNDIISKIGGKCAKNKVSQFANGFTVESACTFGTTKMNSRTVFTGDFNRQYTAVTTSSYDPPLQGTSSANSQVSGRWLGPCEKDQAPGDIITADGKKVNLLQPAQGN